MYFRNTAGEFSEFYSVSAVSRRRLFGPSSSVYTYMYIYMHYIHIKVTQRQPYLGLLLHLCREDCSTGVEFRKFHCNVLSATQKLGEDLRWCALERFQLNFLTVFHECDNPVQAVRSLV